MQKRVRCTIFVVHLKYFMQLSHKKFEINRSYQLNNNLSIGSIRYLSKNDFDFDIYLHTKKCNLQRDLVWTDLQKQQLILSLLKEISIPKFAVIQKDSLDTKIKYKKSSLTNY